METASLYKDIQGRTGGDIYLGVVGPVRTGKSTFIKHFMELLVLPGMEPSPLRDRAKDELPQSSGGKTIMTTEPKFIPQEAAKVQIDEEITLNIRLIDCVGYMVEGASGHMENSQERLVKTPWYDYEIPFTKAAEIGTRKVITEHSTVGIVITSDGSFGDLTRAAYEAAEERTIKELKQLHKPFILLLNSQYPHSQDAKQLAEKLSTAYDCNVLPISCEQLRKEDIYRIMKSILLEFPVTALNFYLPKWVESLSVDHWLKSSLLETIQSSFSSIIKMKDLYGMAFPENEYVESLKIDCIDLSTGKVNISVHFDDSYYYRIISDMIEIPISNEYEFMDTVRELASKKREYEEAAAALNQARQAGYGIMKPTRSDVTLKEPVIIRHGGKFGVKIHASAPSIHLIKANISTEIAPIVGTEDQAKDLINYIKEEASNGEDSIWNVNIFGKTMEQMIADGIQEKASKIHKESQLKLQNTMEKIVNEGNGGMVCIII
ncbi:MAG: stage IV sporulation protein A [Lachnospiraceae bacterium]|nr:stage IV sporulation protein A [Lachnospiraceae bacterium]